MKYKKTKTYNQSIKVNIIFIITVFVFDDMGIDWGVCCYTEWKGSMVI